MKEEWEDKARKLLQDIRDKKEQDYNGISISEPVPETEEEKILEEEDAKELMEKHELSNNLPEPLEAIILNNLQAVNNLEEAKKVVGFAEGMKKDMITEEDRKPDIDLSKEKKAKDLLETIEERREVKENYDAMSLSQPVPESKEYFAFPPEKVEKTMKEHDLWENLSKHYRMDIYKQVRTCNSVEEAKDIIEQVEEIRDYQEEI